MTDHERHLRAQIARLHREYSDLIAPYVEELVKLEAVKPPRPVMWSTFPGLDIDAIHKAREVLEVGKAID